MRAPAIDVQACRNAYERFGKALPLPRFDANFRAE
jgi:hypothetical protein